MSCLPKNQPINIICILKSNYNTVLCVFVKLCYLMTYFFLLLHQLVNAAAHVAVLQYNPAGT